MNITMVKKVRLDGKLCCKSAEVSDKLKSLQLIDQINKVVFAEEGNPSSKGLKLAFQYGVDSAPFFIVEQNNSTQIYTKYSLFIKEVLGHNISEKEEIAEIMAQNPDLDFI